MRGVDLSDLLAHMLTQHYGFAAAAPGESADLAVWQVRPLGDDPVAAYTAAAEHVFAAFAGDGVLEREFALPEISTSMTFPAARAIRLPRHRLHRPHLGVARALASRSIDPELLEAGWQIARRSRMANGGSRPALPSSRASLRLRMAASWTGSSRRSAARLRGRTDGRSVGHLPSLSGPDRIAICHHSRTLSSEAAAHALS